MHDGKYASRTQMQTRTHKLWLRLYNRYDNGKIQWVDFFLTILWFQDEWEWRVEARGSMAMDS